MRMMLVGAGAVGESILKVMKWRDPKGEWLEFRYVYALQKHRLNHLEHLNTRWLANLKLWYSILLEN